MAENKTKQRVLHFLGLHILYYLLIILLKTLRVNIENYKNVEKRIKEKQNFVLAFWHGSMLIPWYYHRNKNFSALVSRSKDGEILTRILTRWKYKVIRGSSNLGGKEALDILLAEAASGKNIAITPDGPKGPAHEMKAGAVICAKKANIPLFLLAAKYDKKYVLKSWDKFEIPRPFSNVTLHYSDAIYFNPESDYETTAAMIKECEANLISLHTKGSNIA